MKKHQKQTLLSSNLLSVNQLLLETADLYAHGLDLLVLLSDHLRTGRLTVGRRAVQLFPGVCKLSLQL